MSDGAINAVLYHDTLGSVVLYSLLLAVGFISLSLWNLKKMLRGARRVR